MLGETIDVFISSTCYDLVDLRDELGKRLIEHGMIVRLSDDPGSAFYNDATGDSIASCLKNVEASRAVVVIIDRRYGRKLPDRFGAISATHAEVRHAQKLGKPVLFFIRTVARDEYQQLRGNRAYDTKWISKPADDWFIFVDELFTLPAHADKSNWYDQFRTSVDLKEIVVRRLVMMFPEFAVAKAMAADRLVRLTYIDMGADRGSLAGCFKNLGIGPAFNLVHGVCRIPDPFNLDVAGGPPIFVLRLGGLREGDTTIPHNSPVNTYSLNDNAHQHIKLFCEYENRFGDKYRIENFSRLGASKYDLVPPERVFVHSPSGSWVRAIPSPAESPIVENP